MKHLILFLTLFTGFLATGQSPAPKVVYLEIVDVVFSSEIPNGGKDSLAFLLSVGTAFAQPFPSVNEVRRVKNPNIRFEWTLGDTTEFGKNHLIVLHYSITNLSEDTINYLCQSCNHLDYYLHPRPNQFSVSPSFHCNASWAVIRKLAPGETLDATTRLMWKPTDSKTEPLKIGLDFIAVDRYIPFEDLKRDEGPVEKLYRGKIDWDQVIWKELE